MDKNLEQIRARAATESGHLADANRVKIFVASSADSPDADAVLESLQKDIDRHDLKAVAIAAGSCGYYDLEPLVTVEKPGSPAILYPNVTPEKASALVNNYLLGDKTDGSLDIDGMPLFALQERIALRNCGRTDPINIGHYILLGNGYGGLSRALQMSPDDIIGELEKSELRGRGGGDFPTAEKWQICRGTEADVKYVVCDAVNADPSARTARLLLEGDPHSVLEGMLIAGLAVGASRGIVCVNSDYSIAIERLGRALEQMRDYGLLGDGILGSAFRFDIEVKEVASSLVAGEETALIRFLEGKQPMPYLRTVYPAVRGLDEKPTLVNNVETLAHVSVIFQNGSAWYSAIGTERGRGTKIVTLSGDVAHQYTVEVPLGTSLRTLVMDIGGAAGGIGAVQFGGPAGCYFDIDSLDIPVDYEALAKAGCIMGSATVRVFGGGSCAVEMARDAVSYLQAESCGKCVLCREGTYQMLDILDDIAANRGKPEDLDLLLELGEGIKAGSICGLGRAAPDPVLSSLRLFRSDYDAHLKGKKRPAAESG